MTVYRKDICRKGDLFHTLIVPQYGISCKFRWALVKSLSGLKIGPEAAKVTPCSNRRVLGQLGSSNGHTNLIKLL